MVVYSLKDHIKKSLSAILIMTLLFLLSSCRDIRQRLPFGRHSLNEAFEWAKKDSARLADSLKGVMSDKKVVKRTLTDSLMGIEGQKLPAGNPGPNYFIIAGSYTDHENAKQVAERYSAKGYKTTIISSTSPDGSKLELVSVKTFSDHKKASIFLKEFKGKYDAYAWIYTRK